MTSSMVWSVQEAGERIENEVFDLSCKLIGRDLDLHGTLCITAPDAFAIKLLTPLLAQLPFAKWLKKHFPSAGVVYRSNSLLGLYEAAKRGMGIVPLPCFLGDPESGLQRVIDPPEELASELWLLTHPDLRRTARVRALADGRADCVRLRANSMK